MFTISCKCYHWVACYFKNVSWLKDLCIPGHLKPSPVLPMSGLPFQDHQLRIIPPVKKICVPAHLKSLPQCHHWVAYHFKTTSWVTTKTSMTEIKIPINMLPIWVLSTKWNTTYQINSLLIKLPNTNSVINLVTDHKFGNWFNYPLSHQILINQFPILLLPPIHFLKMVTKFGYQLPNKIWLSIDSITNSITILVTNPVNN